MECPNCQSFLQLEGTPINPNFRRPGVGRDPSAVNQRRAHRTTRDAGRPRGPHRQDYFAIRQSLLTARSSHPSSTDAMGTTAAPRVRSPSYAFARQAENSRSAIATHVPGRMRLSSQCAGVERSRDCCAFSFVLSFPQSLPRASTRGRESIPGARCDAVKRGRRGMCFGCSAAPRRTSGTRRLPVRRTSFFSLVLLGAVTRWLRCRLAVIGCCGRWLGTRNW